MVQWLRSLVGELRLSLASGSNNQNIKQKQYWNKFNKDLKKMVHIKKKNLKKKNTMFNEAKRNL